MRMNIKQGGRQGLKADSEIAKRFLPLQMFSRRRLVGNQTERLMRGNDFSAA